MDLDKIRKELLQGLDYYSSLRGKELFKRVALIALKSRIDELRITMTCDSERLHNKRIAELGSEILGLEEPDKTEDLSWIWKN